MRVTRRVNSAAVARLRRALAAGALALALAVGATAGGAPDERAQSLWQTYTPEQRAAAIAFAGRYAAFLAANKTPEEVIATAVAQARDRGFRTLEELDADGTRDLLGGRLGQGGRGVLSPGERIVVTTRGKTACLIVVGRRPAREGVRIVGAHVDSPHIVLKPNPLYGASGFAMFNTSYYGGMKRYQWVNVPLALHARIHGSGGAVRDVVIGEAPGDPVFIIPDLLPHLDSSLRGRTQRDVISGEELDPIAGSVPPVPPAEGDLIEHVRRVLQDEHGLGRDDLAVSVCRLVPATAPRDVGIDRGLVGGYGQDDKACAFPALQTLLEMGDEVPELTAIAYLVEQEEVGSPGVSGAGSDWLRSVIGELVERTLPSPSLFSENVLRAALQRSEALSADVTGGLDPLFPGVHDESNAARLGRGVVIKRYGFGHDPEPDHLRSFVDRLDRAHVRWQVSMLGRVDAGGGGTIAEFLRDDSIPTIDVGVPVLSMHSPFEVSCKVDLLEMRRACDAFFGTGPEGALARGEAGEGGGGH